MADKATRAFALKKGLDIPLQGTPEQRIGDAAPLGTVAALGFDFTGLRPRMSVEEGDTVRLGETLFTDKRHPEIRITAPGCGEVVAINRGAKRALQSVVIRLAGDEAVDFGAFAEEQLATLGDEEIRKKLLASGLWAAFRTRPFSKVPAPDAEVPSLFVTAIDTRPLAADPAVIIADAAPDFLRGLDLLLTLTRQKIYLCTAPGGDMPAPDDDRLIRATFAGPHPAGLVGTHVHFLEPVGTRRSAWHIGYQDVIAIGRLFVTGMLPVERIVAIGGPMALNPRLVRTRCGASTEDLLAGEVASGQVRVISGSVLSGHRAAGPLAWLGRYHDQLTLIAENRDREFLHWMRPGASKYSSERAYAGHLLHRDGFALTTTQNGSPRAMVPIGSFEKVMPLDILPTPLLKALLVEDTDRARELGCLELDEEDLSLCSFVCNGKYEYGPYLRMTLDEIEVNG